MTNKALIAQLKGKMKSRKEAGDDVWFDLEKAAAALEAQEWRTDMENAPRDGTWLLLGYEQQGDEMPKGLMVGVGYLDETGRVYPMNCGDNEKAHPSSWRPLPPAPEGE